MTTPLLDLAPVQARLERWCVDHGLQGERVVREGLPGRTVSEEAERVGADVVVLGATGASGIERVLLGSSAHAIVRSLHCSALIARGQVEEYRTMVFATDFGEPSRVAARLAGKLPEFPTADLVAAHVRESDSYDPAPELAEFNREVLGGRARETALTGPPVRTLIRLVETERADLLVVGNDGHGAVERFILGDVAGAIAERAPCSVLIGRPPK